MTGTVTAAFDRSIEVEVAVAGVRTRVDGGEVVERLGEVLGARPRGRGCSSTSSWRISSSNSDGSTMAAAPASSTGAAVVGSPLSGDAEATIGERSVEPEVAGA